MKWLLVSVVMLSACDALEPPKKPAVTPVRTRSATPSTADNVIENVTVNPSVVIERPQDERPRTRVVRDTMARVRLWKREDDTCYLSVDVPGWKDFFIDASGAVCDQAPAHNGVAIEPVTGKESAR